MRSVEARFNQRHKDPASTYLAFARAVRGQGFSRNTVARNFVQLVEADEYEKKDKNKIIDFLVQLSSGSRSTT